MSHSCLRYSAYLAAMVIGMSATFSSPAASQSDDRLTPARIYSTPPLSGSAPRRVSFSPDGQSLAFLRGKPEDEQRLDLWAYDIETGEERVLVDADAFSASSDTLSEAERARRERQRISATGIVEYGWDDAGDAILAPLQGDLYYVDLSGDTPDIQRLTETESDETDARIAPGGQYVSFVRDRSLVIVDIGTGEERVIAESESELVSYGAAEFVAQEEMYRHTGYWWSPDARWLAYARVDNEPVAVVERVDIGAEGSVVVPQRYPRAGATNATVQLFIVDMDNGSQVEVDLGPETDIYLARVHWLGDQLVLERQNRAQTVLDVLAADPSTGETRALLQETSDSWVNITSDFTPIDDGAAFLWTSERDGFRHLYLYNADGTLVRQVTSGDWALTSTDHGGGAILGVDEDAGIAYLRGFADTPLEQHLYAVAYREDGAELQRITAPGAWWSVSMNAPATAFVATVSSPDQPPQVALYTAAGERLTWLEENALDADHAYAPYLSRHISPEFGTIPAEDGTPLHYSITRPPHCSAETPCPALVLLYGGPGVQTVTRAWGGAPLTQMLVQRGYVVFELDNRGSSERGKAFEAALHRSMAGVEVRDHLTGLEFLKAQEGVDPASVGVRGASYGGYMVLHLLAQAPEAYAAGVSIAPVSDWTLYDTHYTERYMSTPQDNADGYETSSIFPHLEALSRPLLLVHGMADDNVVFEHSTRVMRALQEAGTPFEAMVYPGERHSISSPGPRRHLTEGWVSFFDRHLKPTPAP